MIVLGETGGQEAGLGVGLARDAGGHGEAAHSLHLRLEWLRRLDSTKLRLRLSAL